MWGCGCLILWPGQAASTGLSAITRTKNSLSLCGMIKCYILHLIMQECIRNLNGRVHLQFWKLYLLSASLEDLNWSLEQDLNWYFMFLAADSHEYCEVTNKQIQCPLSKREIEQSKQITLSSSQAPLSICASLDFLSSLGVKAGSLNQRCHSHIHFEMFGSEWKLLS